MIGVAQQLGSAFLQTLQTGGQLVLLLRDTLRALVVYPIRWRLIIRQIYLVGVQSQSVILVTGAFLGAVFAAQIQFQFGPLGMNSAVGPVVSVAMCRELGPVVCALMLAGRVGAAMAAELSTMKITEQIDALRALAVYPVEYLVVPRFLALLISMPILVAMAVAIGIGAGYFVAVDILGVDGVYYIFYTEKFTLVKDVWIGLIKSFFFALIIVLVSCNKGLNCSHGAEGVGRATTEAVVNSSLIVLICNFFFTFLLNMFFPT
jgi:phospholipid/cholesterol/gamma-HCH transport system permease protein